MSLYSPDAGKSLPRLFRPVRMPEEHAGQIRTQQLDAVMELMPIVMMIVLLNTAVVLLSFWQSNMAQLLAIWGAAVCFITGVNILLGVRYASSSAKASTSPRSIERFARGALTMGLMWGVAPIIVAPDIDPTNTLVLGSIILGMMFAGAFILSRIPKAAFGFVIPIGVGFIVGMQNNPDPRHDLLSVLTVVYLVMLAVSIRWNHVQYVEQLIDQAGLRQQSQVISILLRDFDETTSDRLWQTDPDGAFQELPLALAQGKTKFDAKGAGGRLLELFEPSEATTILSKCIERRQDFRDIVAPVMTSEGRRWWQIAGKPMFETGVFQGFRGVISDVTTSKQYEDRIAYMAHYDGLTGLPNRMSLQETLEKAVRTPPMEDRARALALLDLDNFKWVNDTLGHQAGDRLLKMVADRLTEACEDSDVIARLGGDEFALIIERSADEGAISKFVDDLADSMARPYSLWGVTVRCSASIGLRLLDPFASDSNALLKHADLALYQAKSDGKGRGKWCMFSTELDAKARVRQQIEADLQAALDNNELRVHFQPQVDAHTRELVGVEALMRWQHPQRGLVMPSDFIELAEDCGLITRLGDWVIRQALDEARRFPEHLSVAINISPLQIHAANLFSTIVNALGSTGRDPSKLELEITESVLMSDTSYTLDRLHQLRDLGVRISLDDFGTGFASLSYLRRFPFDKIKIDQSFVRDLETSEDSRAITVATLKLAKSLGLRCTAEGVETEFQASFLAAEGCDELQGFFVSRAQPIGDLGHLIDLLDMGAVAAKRQPLKLVKSNPNAVPRRNRAIGRAVE